MQKAGSLSTHCWVVIQIFYVSHLWHQFCSISNHLWDRALVQILLFLNFLKICTFFFFFFFFFFFLIIFFILVNFQFWSLTIGVNSNFLLFRSISNVSEISAIFFFNFLKIWVILIFWKIMKFLEKGLTILTRDARICALQVAHTMH